MKRLLSTLLLLSLLFGLGVPALAAEEGPEKTPAPATHTVSTLDELQTALTYAVDNDTIAITTTITVPNIMLSTDKPLTFTRADSSFEGALIELETGATLDGLSFVECGNSPGTITVLVDEANSVLIQNCTFSRPEGTEFSYGTYIIAGTGHANDEVEISNCQFSGTVYYSISGTGNVTVSNCNISNSGGIYNFRTMSVSNTTIIGNTSRNGAGGITNRTALTISNCEIYGNSGVYGADIYSYGTLSITDEEIEGGAFYNEDTNEKVEVPLTNYAETIKLKYVADTTPEPEPEPTPEPTPTTYTVSTLDELKTALTYAIDDDTIVISNSITITDEIISTDKAVMLTRADGYTGDLLILGSNGGLSGFTIYDDAAFSSTVLVAVNAENVSIENCAFSGDGATFTYFVSAYSGVTITDTTFQDNGGVALAIPNNAATVSVSNCTFVDNAPPTGESAITNSGALLLENTKIYENTGGIFNNGTLTVSNSEIYSNTEADLYNRGTLNIAESAEESGYYKADTGEKLTLPLSDYSDTVNLLYLTDEEAAQRFAPPEPDPAPTPEPTPTPDPEPEEDDEDDYTPPVYRPSRPVVITKPEPESEPEPAPALICGDAVIDLSRSVVLHGYGDGQLHLEDSLTRGQMATIIYRLLDEDTIAKYDTAENAFDDVPADMWCCTAISTIAKAGIVNGVGNDRFNPNGKLTWAHIITVMTRFVEPQTYQLQNIQYDGWAAEAVQTAVALGWIEDRADLDPSTFITRGEFMEFVNNILALYQTI